MKKKKDWLKLAEVVALVDEGLTDAQIGRALKANADTVKHFRLVNGLKCNRAVKASISPEQEDVVRRLAARGFTDAQIGRVLDVSFKTIFYARQRLGVRSARTVGPEVVKQVKRMVKEKKTDREIAESLGRSLESVRRIRRGAGIRRRTPRTKK